MFWRKRKPSDFRAEIEAHLELEAEQLKEQGWSEEDARVAARRAFGNVTRAEERFYESGRWLWWDHLMQDLRFGLRQLKRNPGFTAVVVVILALGIGANSAVFSVMNGLFLRGLPVPEPERVMSFSGANFSWADYVTYRDETRSFERLSSSYAFPFTASLSSIQPPQHIYGGLVTGDFITTLGIKLPLGRGFFPDEDQIGSPKSVVILSHQLWRSRYGGDPTILGRAIRLNNADYTVVGVMPSDFRSLCLGIAPDIWAPMATLPQLDQAEEAAAHPFINPHEHGFLVFGRLKRGVSRLQAEAELNLVNDRLRKGTGSPKGQPIVLTTAGLLPGEFGRMFFGLSVVLMVIAGLVLVVACVNIANLLLAHGSSRRREIAIRLALGAGRWRVIWQLMVANLILAFLGAAAGLVLAWLATKALGSVELPLPFPIALGFAPDHRVLMATSGIAVLSALVFGLAPAARATRVDVNASLKGGGIYSTRFGTLWVRNGLAIVQVAVTVIVTVAATLFLHSLWNGLSTKLGFCPENVLVVKVDATGQGYSRERNALFIQRVEEQVSRLPGVRSASVVAPLPLGIVTSDRVYTIQGSSRAIDARMHMVGPHYFETMGIPLKRGRDFRGIPVTSPRVAVISRSMAAQLFPSGDPIGRQVGWEWGKLKKSYEVIGVVGDMKSGTVGEVPSPCLFELAMQNQDDAEMFSRVGINFVVETAGKPKTLALLVQQEVANVDPGVPVYGVETMEEQVGKSLVVARLVASFLGAFGFLAVALAVVGLYGLMSYSVNARTREIAIRMALGASAERTLFRLVRQGLSVVGLGLAAGVAAGFAVDRLVSSLLYGVGSFDGTTFVVVPITLMGAACLAIVLPARRATKVDPMVALRYE